MQIVLQLLGYIHNSPQAAEKESLPFITQSIPACHFFIYQSVAIYIQNLKYLCFVSLK